MHTGHFSLVPVHALKMTLFRESFCSILCTMEGNVNLSQFSPPLFIKVS